MEQIYTIPVNEAFDAVAADNTLGCPFCVLFRKLEEDELDIILGASMMEPDIRMKTNEMGFCGRHYARMLKRKRMLGLGLILESHLAEVNAKVTAKTLVGDVSKASRDAVRKLNGECYVCSRIDKNLTAMTATASFLWETDEAFRKKFENAPYFCLPHYEKLVDYSALKMPKKVFRDFFGVACGIEKKYLETLTGDVSWFCKKFDYRFDEEPWYNAKDSLPRAVKFLTGEQDDN